MRFLALALTLLLLVGALPASAAEVIERFAQTVRVGADDTLAVIEEITVRAEGDRIRRGIYRDFPTTFVDADGRTRQVPFSVSSVTRDGREEPFKVERGDGGSRIWIGQEDVFLAPGRYIYVLSYQTGRQIRRFDDHDELVWNVNGNDWAFPILATEARVILPEGAHVLRTTAYTGLAGERGTDYRESRSPGGAAVTFSATRRLAPGENLTIVLSLPKGVIAEPTSADEARYFFLEHGASLLAGAGLIAVLLYYAVAWNRVGRDPPKGTIIPRWDPPPVSPPLARYVHERGFSGGGWTALAAGWVSLAVKGLVTLDDSSGTLALARTGDKAPADLPKSEKTLLDWLEGRGGAAVINRAAGPSVQSLNGSFRKAVEGESRETFFRNNRGFAFLGIALSVAAIALAVVLSPGGEEEIAGLMPMLFAGVFGFVGVQGVLAVVRGPDLSRRFSGVIQAVVGIAGLIGGSAGSTAIVLSTGGFLALPVVGLVLVLVNALFFVLLAAPTVNGRKLMDTLEGLLLYMTVAEEKRLNMAGLPKVTPSRYETLLPYAVALGVEKPWTEALQAELARAAAAGAAATYEPAWYHGRPGRDLGSAMSRSLSAMSGSFRSSVPPPKSSSSGFSSSSGSGSGGGGGGGGGW